MTDSIIGGAQRLHRGPDLFGLVLGVDLKIRRLVQDALRQRGVAWEAHRDQLLHGHQHEDQAHGSLGERLRVRGHPREARAGVQGPHRVAHVARIERRAHLHLDQHAHGLRRRTFVGDLAHPRRPTLLAPERRRRIAPGQHGRADEREDHSRTPPARLEPHFIIWPGSITLKRSR